MLKWFFRKTLEQKLNETKKITVHHVDFVIRKINPLDYMSGSRVVRQIFETAKSISKDSVEITQPNITQIKAHYSDVFLAAIVTPQLKKSKDDESPGLPVEHLLTDWELASELYGRIYEYAYGKKKLTK